MNEEEEEGEWVDINSNEEDSRAYNHDSLKDSTSDFLDSLEGFY